MEPSAKPFEPLYSEEFKVLNEEQKAKYVPEGMPPEDYELLGLALSANRRPSEALSWNQARHSIQKGTTNSPTGIPLLRTAVACYLLHGPH